MAGPKRLGDQDAADDVAWKRVLLEVRSGSALLGKVGLDATSRARRLAFLEFGPTDEARLAEVREFAYAHVDEIVDAFYAHLLSFEETAALLREPGQVARLKKLQREYFLRMTEGRLDAAFFESRLRVGVAHARIDLKPEWYLGTYNLYLRLLMSRLRDHYGTEPDRLHGLLESLCKVVFLDMGLAIDAYIWSGYVDRALAQEYRRMAEVAERTLREKEDVERMKADLTNMIVHDLKGPLGGILTVAQLALRKRTGAPEDHARHLEQIQRSARDLLRMIENLLEIDQMEEGRLVLRAEPVELGPMLTECADEFRAAAEIAGQTLAVTLGHEIPVIVTDRWLLRRVLNNLVVNAIRHSGAAGRIELEAACNGGVVRLRVRDAGRGILPEEQATLFVKHGRRPRREQSRDDTGIGLVFCKMAVEVMGGTIGVESAPGAGATFTVTLPTAVEG
ncbi:MAG: protoglobin domain-containing protein, partial [Candidatus Binatia bacterium]